jgi:2-keto-4-pentenoate hydratase/2-oxohepta-3-ene-1,7-dioic acid hydratase in catechol pathway
VLEAGWMLVSYRLGDSETPRLGVLDGGVIKTAPDFLSSLSLLEVIDAWDDVSTKLQAWTPPASGAVTDARLTTPLQFPRKVICAGANYYGHLAEMGIDRPDGSVRPYFFFKPPSTTVTGPGDAIRLPARSTSTIDWEAELGVVIGRRAHNVRAEQARSYVAGYTIVNDISARDRLVRPDTWLRRSDSTGSVPKPRIRFARSGPASFPTGSSRILKTSPSGSVSTAW